MKNILNILSGVLRGTRAITTQSYAEANVKNGMQFYTRIAFPIGDEIASGQSRFIAFVVGSKPLVVKSRNLQSAGEEAEVRTYISPTGLTGGTTVDVGVFNGMSSNTPETTALKDPTFTTKGTETLNVPEYIFGATNQRQSDGSSLPLGREFIFPPGVQVLIEIKNSGGGSLRFSYFADFYEGDVDLPRKEMS